MTAQPIDAPRGMVPRAELAAIAARHGLTLADLRSKLRFKAYVAARRECYRFLADRGWSTPQIGRFFNRDHSTVVVALDNLGTQAERLERQRAYTRKRKGLDPWAKKLGARAYDAPAAGPQPPPPRPAEAQQTAIQSEGGREMTKRTTVLFALPGSMNLRMVSDEKCDWLRAVFGVELTSAPTCAGRLAWQDEAESVVVLPAPQRRGKP